MKSLHKIKDEIYKLIYKMTHTKSYWHNRKRWPHVKIERKNGREITRLFYNNNEIPIISPEDIKNRYSGSILLTATGPSVRDINFKNKNSIPAMGVNGAIFLKPHIDFSFYVITDIHFPSHRPEVIEEITSESKVTLFTTIDVMVEIFEKVDPKKIKCSFYPIEDLTDKIYEKKLSTSEAIALYKNKKNFFSNNEVGFSADITDGVFPAKTVIYWALQIIAHLGFESIYIIGLDMNNFNKPRFYEDEKNKIHTQLEQDMQSIMTSFEHASYVLKNHLNIKVINLSINSSLPEDIFEKSEYNKYFDYT